MYAAIMALEDPDTEEWHDAVTIHNTEDDALRKVFDWVKFTWDPDIWEGNSWSQQYPIQNRNQILLDFFGRVYHMRYSTAEIQSGAPPLPSNLDSDPVDLNMQECRAIFIMAGDISPARLADRLKTNGSNACDIIGRIRTKFRVHRG